ncbi:hypothetical protein MHK_008050 [Candidatus Magnetomorum sp. HK-1]|nr:hypothetical protein MHK_008050 [Candidatus Magnetomorum sp. HK-1]
MKKCFVAMPFDKSFDIIYQIAIKQTVEEAGYECLRADELPRGGSILSNIVRNINNSQLIIVDMTGQNPNVMYELGLSHAFRKNVILIARDKSDVPSDLESYYAILYKNPDDEAYRDFLKKKILESIISFEDKTQTPGNPVIEHLSKDEQPPDPKAYKKIQTELMKKEQELIKQKSRSEAFEQILQYSKGTEKINEKQAIENIKKRKFEFKFIGQRP